MSTSVPYRFLRVLVFLLCTTLLSNTLETSHITSKKADYPYDIPRIACGGIVGGTGNNDDFDGDGVCNSIDVDDDNDGILDVNESSRTGLLVFEFYDGLPSGNTVDNIPTTGALATGFVSDFDVTALQNTHDPGDTDEYAIRYRGFITISTSETYTFYSASDDGSKVYIDGVIAVNNDGLHGTSPEVSGTIALTPGIHEIVIEYFEDIGGDALILSYSSPTITKVAIPFSVLSTYDTDNDGQINSFDMDSDNDGIADIIEAGGVDSNGDGMVDGSFTDTDGDGWSNIFDADDDGYALDAPDTDKDGFPDFLDIDADGDGIVDVIEAQASSATPSLPVGTDSDGDGIDDSFDPNSSNSLLTPINTDGQSFPDYQDADSDNDAHLDAIEAYDTNNDGSANTTASGNDSDEDGLDDNYDNVVGPNASANVTNNGQTSASFPNLDNTGTTEPDWRETGDNDGDGILDNNDLDDDNDGVLDADEISTKLTYGFTGTVTGERDRGAGNNDLNRDLVFGVDYGFDLDFSQPVDVEIHVTVGDPSFARNGTVTVDGTAENVNIGANEFETLVFSPVTNSDYSIEFYSATDISVTSIEVYDASDNLIAAFDFQLTGANLASGYIEVNQLTSSTTVSVNAIIDADGDGLVNRFDLDSDNDGLPDIVEAGGVDSDGDGLVDGIFTDSNGNGLSNVFDNTNGGTPLANNDTDLDGLSNRLDLDSDNDGLSDILEAGGIDADGNGIADGTFSDTDADGFSDIFDTDDGGNSLSDLDTDSDGFENRIDIDSDGDGIIDLIEAQISTASPVVPIGADADVDGIDDNFDPDSGNNLLTPVNTDAFGAPDYLDTDSDQDGDLDALEAYDTDNDGNANTIAMGADTDGDGLDDNFDTVVGPNATTNVTNNGQTAYSFPNLDVTGTLEPDWRETKDTDGDGVVDSADIDDDNDGILDADETASNLTYEFGGTITGDRDRGPQNNDLLRDFVMGKYYSFSLTFDHATPIIIETTIGEEDYARNGTVTVDGVAELISTPANVFQTVTHTPTTNSVYVVNIDTSNPNASMSLPSMVVYDTLGNIIAAFDFGQQAGILEPGYIEVHSLTPATTIPVNVILDTDNDGVSNRYDLDSDNDGVADIAEAGGTDTNRDGKVDGTFTDTDEDGWSNLFDSDNGGTALADADFDSDGLKNRTDLDSDGDGIIDLIETQQSTSSPRMPTGIDSDSDGIDDAFDNDVGGLLATQYRTGSTGLADYLNLDSDDDGDSDALEAYDTNNDGIAETLPAGTDTDGDGLDDSYDLAVGSSVASVTNNGQNAFFFPNLDKPSTNQVDWRESSDSDGDGVPDGVDVDDDNDGILDVDEHIINGYLNYTFYDAVPSGNTVDNIPFTSQDGKGRVNDFDVSAIQNTHDPGDPDNFAIRYTGFISISTTETYTFYSASDDGSKIYINGALVVDNDGLHGISPEVSGTIALSPGVYAIVIEYFEAGSGDILGISYSSPTITKEALPFSILSNFDTDNDGVINSLDLDSDGDGIADIVEAGGTDTDGDGLVDGTFTDTDGDGLVDGTFTDTDGDGWSNVFDSDNNGYPLLNPDTDGDGFANAIDIDSDGDGIIDLIEAQASSASPVVPVGFSFNQNGIDFNFDIAISGTLITPVDTDGSGGADYIDTDSDNDGDSDSLEAYDTDNDGNANTIAMGADTDGDGLDDKFDVIVGPNTTTNVTNNGQTAFSFPNLDFTATTEPDWRETKDTDGDGVVDSADIDDDNDGILDADETASNLTYEFGGTITGDRDRGPQNNDLLRDFVMGKYYSFSLTFDHATPIIIETTIGEEDYARNGTVTVNGVAELISTPANVFQTVTHTPTTNSVYVVNIDTSNPNASMSLPTMVVYDTFGNIIAAFDFGQQAGILEPGYIEVHSLTPATTIPVNVILDSDNDGIINRFDVDSDNDGLADIIEAGGTDTDGDGIVDGTFTDTDGDGWSNVFDSDNGGTALSNPDTDLDGKADEVDLDSDNDGIADIIEAEGTDSDGNGTVDGVFADADGDGYSNVFDTDNGGVSLSDPDTDSDGFENRRDIDSDGDGIVDVLEAQISSFSPSVPGGSDADADGIDDNFDPDSSNSLLVPINTDGTDNPDYIDTDSDNDGDSDALEGYDTNNNGKANTTSSGSDTDLDGLDDNYDNVIGPNASTNVTNGGQTMFSFTNFDKAITTEVDLREANDTDGDGIIDVLDIDDDNDGIRDFQEQCRGGELLYAFYGGRPTGNTVDNIPATGALGTGTVDNFDVSALQLIYQPGSADNFSIRYTGFITISTTETYTFYSASDDGSKIYISGVEVLDNDGLHGTNPEVSATVALTPGVYPIIIEYFEATGGDVLNMSYSSPSITKTSLPFSALSTCDADGDGITNQFDLDSDNDGITDIIESGGVDTDGNGIVDGSFTDNDGDGWANTFDSDNGGNALKQADTDADGIVDRIDLDSDGDGIADILEAGGVDADGNGIVDGTFTDTDLDGWSNTFDSNNGGTVLNDPDTDADGIENRIDIDSDGDGIIDIIEAQITTGSPDIPAGSDTDNDGIDDNFDPDSGNNLLVPINTDAKGNPDYTDTDSDLDGDSDMLEAYDTNNNGASNKSAKNTDLDGDGLDDEFDNVVGPNSTTNITNNGQTALDFPNLDVTSTVERDWREGGDTDSDGVPNGVDVDDDNDGILDVDELCQSGFLAYEFYDGTPSGNTVDNIPVTGATGVGLVDDFNVRDLQSYWTPSSRDDFAIRYKGFINISTSDTYTFYLSSDDGSKLYIDGNLVVDNDGLQVVSTEASGSITLTTGFHSIIIEYFEYLSSNVLNVSYESTSISKTSLPFSILYSCDEDGDGVINRLDLDSDDDGVGDIVEAGGTDLDGDGKVDGTFTDTDGDGFSDVFDIDNGGTALPSPDSDSDGLLDMLDLDSDNDGIPDIIESQLTLTFKSPFNSDIDGDGIDDRFDRDIHLGRKLITPVNTDEADLADYLDLDSDNDGTNDILESGSGLPDANTDGRTDNAVGFNGLDNTIDWDDSYQDPNGIFDSSQEDNFTDTDLDVLLTDGDVDFRDNAFGRPGGKSENILLWLRGDVGGSNWADQTGNGVSVTKSGSIISGAYLNFNDMNAFGGSSYFQTDLDINRTVHEDLTVFVVYVPLNNTEATVWGNGSSRRHITISNQFQGVIGLGFHLQTNVQGLYTQNFPSLAVETIRRIEPEEQFVVHSNGTGVLNLYNTNPFSSSTSNRLQLGALGDGTSRFNGYIAEAIVYKDAFEKTSNHQQVETYLALKYGITLAPDSPEGAIDAALTITEGDYIASDGSTILWDASNNLTHHNNVAGILRDDLSNFTQKQSKSVNADAIVTIGLDDDNDGLESTNPTNPSTFSANLSALVWGHDGESLGDRQSNMDYDPIQVNSRLNREWRVRETGTIGTVTVEFDVSALPGPTGPGTSDESQIVLLVDANGDFSTGATVVNQSFVTPSDDIVKFQVDFSDGYYFTLASAEYGALPVTLLSFEAKAETDHVLLKWSTISESDNSQFAIERTTDGFNFETIGHKEGAGNSQSFLQYEWIDENPLEGISYYRLADINSRGDKNYSELRRITFRQSQIQNPPYPNPIHQGATIYYDLLTPELPQVQLFNLAGQQLEIRVEKNRDKRLAIETGTLPEGVYLLSIVQEGRSVKYKIMIRDNE